MKKGMLLFIAYILLSAGCGTENVFSETSDKPQDPFFVSTYFGGRNNDYITSVTTDKDGNVFILGYTGSDDLPVTESAYSKKYNGGVYDVFVAKLTNDLSKVLAVTYLGGGGTDKSSSMFIDKEGNVYVAGTTTSDNFPTTDGAYRKGFSGGTTDGFVAKLDNGLTLLLGSTFIGSAGDDAIAAMSADRDGNIYAAGYTNSETFFTTGAAYQKTFRGLYDAFIVKMNGDLSELLSSTLLGGDSADYATAVAIDRAGYVYVTGYTESVNFPASVNAYSKVFYGVADAFVTKLSADLSAVIASTFLGGGEYDDGRAIVADKNGAVCIAGQTYSSSFPVSENAVDRNLAGTNDVFVSCLKNDLSQITQSTFLGGNGVDYVTAIALDRQDNILVVGHTDSKDFPVTGDAYSGNFKGIYDIFVTRLSADLSKILNSTYIGAESYDYVNGVATDADGNVFAAGNTISKNFPTTKNSYGKTFNGGTSDGIVIRWSLNK